MNTVQAIVSKVEKADPISLKKRLRADWDEYLRGVENQEIDGDSTKAGLIDRYFHLGLNQREIGDCIGLHQSHIKNLLRYHRFLKTGVFKIKEKRFRKFWFQIADKQMIQGAKGYDPEYEAECFAAINKLLSDGKAPMPRKPKSKKPIVAEKLHTIADVHKAARQVYDECKPTLDRLKRLLKSDRATYAPSLLAEAARIVDEKITELFKILADVNEDNESTDAS